MNPFARTRTRRRIAWLALSVWLFVVVSGVANACMLTVQGSYPHHALTHPGAAVAAASEQGAASAEPACFKACGETAQSLSKQPGENSGDSDPTAAMPAPRVAFDASDGAALALRNAVTHRHASDPPIRLRYARLAL